MSADAAEKAPLSANQVDLTALEVASAAAVADGDKDDWSWDANALGIDFGSPSELFSWTLWRGAIGEFIATFFFLFISIGTVVDNQDIGDRLLVSLAFGFAIFVMVYVFASVSMANINPAVTLQLVCIKQLTVVKGIMYVIMQCLGAIAGCAMVHSLDNDKFFSAKAHNAIAPGYTVSAAIGIEIFCTMILQLVVAAATDDRQRDHFSSGLAPLAIGMAVMLAHMISIPVTNTSINPARSFGMAVVADEWDDHWVFWFAPLMASVITAVLYELVIRDKRVLAE
jgi:MIP family channel proteins